MNKSPPTTELQLRFLEQLSYLLTHGYPLLRALEVLSWEKNFQPIALAMQTTLKSGKYIDEAFDDQSFDSSISSYLYFVRLHGDLSTHITSCANMYKRKQTYEKSFKRAIRYPLFLCSFFGILFICIKQFVLPSFDEMLQANGSSTAAHLILQSIDILFWIGGVSISLIILLILFWKTKQKAIPVVARIRMYQKLPFYRAYVRLNTSHQLATHMSTLFQSGLTIQEVLMYLQQQKKLPILSYYAAHIQKTLHAGTHITEALDELYFIDTHLSQIFRQNKELQSLEKDLFMYAKIVTEELHRKSMQIITLIQPIFFGVIAIFIISMYIALMLPMFQMIQTT